MKSIAVYCGSSTGNDAAYVDAARELGAELARRGIELVYGGGNVGLMKEVADSCLAGGGRVIGVMPKQLVNLELSHPGLTHLEVVETMATRKARMEDLAEGFICLPGGIGTLEELTEALTLQQLGNHTGPVALLNVAGFWQPFYDMFATMAQAGFVQQRYIDCLILDSDCASVLDKFAQWTYPGRKWDNF
ncbi:Cytokinin riboside 5'-monophosphate phosphoribohydrolase [Corynebacterium camporealensis]|uniref:Cytokinin riboside 5'-monophosphate phosphoribohydrolase n=1 Tax=Corynebacterium camporealensis TaxID=161896 RepID=A0A0F6QV04_9CORY|nr:TIGR00730 family Rossman fold protein [Corynebacterium camporealensis]AKE38075.1 TIGR00730 family protein [Corynebacterium camporealensis]AVH87400.1 Cytokinin riboside 5'-monophosphate phosphoribohydrolase [Corynebacterium camporealensis]MDY5840898.1 TIGR00730 family Rossman fold protein [Corynebacterium camporealensis]